MQPSPYKILIGPLWNLSNIGTYIQDPNIQPFYMGEAGLRSNLPARPGGEYFSFPAGISPRAFRQGYKLRIADLFADLPWQPDLLIWMGFYFGLPEDLEACPVPSVLVAGDWHLHYTQIRDFVKAFDYVLSDRALLDVLQWQGHTRSAYWPVYSFVPALVKEFPVPQRDLDVSFIGNYTPAVYGERNRYLLRLARMGRQHRVFLGSQIYHPEYSRLLSRSKIVFNHTLRREMNMRVYEAAACGALCLVEEENLEVRDFLPAGESCVLYNATNFEEVIRHYLAHPDEASAIARRGQERIQAFSCEKQFAQLLGMLPGILETVSTARVPRAFNKISPVQRQLLRAAQLATREVPELRAQAILLLEELVLQPISDSERLQVVNALAVCHTDYQATARPAPGAARPDFQFRYSCAEAQALLERGIQAEAPDDPVLLHNLIWIYMLSQRGTALYPLLERQRQAIERIQPGSLETYGLFVLPLGYTQFYLKWQQMHALHEGDPAALTAALTQLLTWSCLFHYGQMAAGVGDAALAVPAFEAANEACGAFSDTYLELARMYMTLQQPAMAIERLRGAIDKGVYYPQAWMLMLQLLIAQGRLAEARESFEIADVLFQSPRFEPIQQALHQLKGLLPQNPGPSRPMGNWGGRSSGLIDRPDKH